jgi:hypothetical protein
MRSEVNGRATGGLKKDPWTANRGPDGDREEEQFEDGNRKWRRIITSEFHGRKDGGFHATGLLEREAQCAGGNWAFASATGETQIQTTTFIWF